MHDNRFLVQKLKVLTFVRYYISYLKLKRLGGREDCVVLASPFEIKTFLI